MIAANFYLKWITERGKTNDLEFRADRQPHLLQTLALFVRKVEPGNTSTLPHPKRTQ